MREKNDGEEDRERSYGRRMKVRRGEKMREKSRGEEDRGRRRQGEVERRMKKRRRG